MRGIFWVLMLTVVITGLANADPYDVRNGVAIAHAPSGLAYSTDPPGPDYCAHYETIAITSCEQQVNTITDPELQAVWYVLLAWTESKYWAAFEFGLSDYDPEAYVITQNGICNPPGGALAITTDVPDPVWPDPGSGIALAAQDRTEAGAWSGNFRPMYWFAGYAYGTTLVSLVKMPASDALSIVPLPGHVGYEQDFWDPATVAGAMGMNTAGKAVCPVADVSGACCTSFGATCTVLTQAECVALSGTFMGADTVCEPSPCTVLSACCVETTCVMLSGTDCTEGYGGLSFPGEICLEDGGTIDCSTPADEHSWGSVKAAYR